MRARPAGGLCPRGVVQRDRRRGLDDDDGHRVPARGRAIHAERTGRRRHRRGQPDRRSRGDRGPVIAAFVLTLIPADLIFLNIDPNFGQVIQGTLIVLVVMAGGLITSVRRSQMSSSRTPRRRALAL